MNLVNIISFFSFFKKKTSMNGIDKKNPGDEDNLFYFEFTFFF